MANGATVSQQGLAGAALPDPNHRRRDFPGHLVDHRFDAICRRRQPDHTDAQQAITTAFPRNSARGRPLLTQPAFCLLRDDTRVATTNQETRRRSEERRLPVSS